MDHVYHCKVVTELKDSLCPVTSWPLSHQGEEQSRLGVWGWRPQNKRTAHVITTHSTPDLTETEKHPPAPKDGLRPLHIVAGACLASVKWGAVHTRAALAIMLTLSIWSKRSHCTVYMCVNAHSFHTTTRAVDDVFLGMHGSDRLLRLTPAHPSSPAP